MGSGGGGWPMQNLQMDAIPQDTDPTAHEGRKEQGVTDGRTKLRSPMNPENVESGLIAALVRMVARLDDLDLYGNDVDLDKEALENLLDMVEEMKKRATRQIVVDPWGSLQSGERGK